MKLLTISSCSVLRTVFAVLVLCLSSNTVTAQSSYTLFESGQVRPLALSPDKSYLYAVNTPDNRLEIFQVTKKGLRRRGSVVVGLEPVAVMARSNSEVWVVNHVSDSISIIDVRYPARAKVIKTLLVGDEPRDIVFAGRNKTRAFITTAHRGQNSPINPQFTTPGVGRADVWVFNAANLGNSLNGAPLTILTFFTDTPRALAVSADGQRVYAAGFHTGNRTTTIFEELVPNGGEAAGGLPSTRVDAVGETQPETGLILKHNGTHWLDELSRTWDHAVPFTLPDKDVFVIDAMANPPAMMPGAGGYFSGVGTVLFNMVVNPVSGRVYVANTEALNHRRFEGAGLRLGRDHTVQGHLHESRITVLDETGVKPRHLNKHIDYQQCCASLPNAENAKSLAQPMGMAVTNDGKTLYVAAFGSSKVGIFNTRQLENNTFKPSTRNQIVVKGGGPSGLVLDEARERLYVLTRFDNSISIIDTDDRKEVAHIAMFNPEPPSIVRGRPFLYDAAFTSSHGDSSCSSCHVFGDFDSLAWDLGDPDGATIPNPGPFTLGPSIPLPQGGVLNVNPHFRTLKGPMTTQSLRGMANHGPMHWRGDRTAANDEPSVQPDSGAFNEDGAFKKFNVAFPGLNGRHEMLEAQDMQAFTDFVLQITYPPNPIRNLDNSLTPDQAAGRAIYFGDRSDTFFNCNVCHVLDPNGNKEFGVAKPGFFGSDGRFSFEGETQILKIPHLRNLYQKVGMFGMASVPFVNPGDNGFKGDQVRGFGFLHDGSFDSLFRFHGLRLFTQRSAGFLSPADPGNPGGFPFLPPAHPLASQVNPIGVKMRSQMEQFMLAFDSNLAPIVGQQVTLTTANADIALPRIALLIQRAQASECDLVAKLHFGAREYGYLYNNGAWKTDSRKRAPITTVELQDIVKYRKLPITYTCVPQGSGVRIGLDRDEDGVLDGDEISVRKQHHYLTSNDDNDDDDDKESR